MEVADPLAQSCLENMPGSPKEVMMVPQGLPFWAEYLACVGLGVLRGDLVDDLVDEVDLLAEVTTVEKLLLLLEF